MNAWLLFALLGPTFLLLGAWRVVTARRLVPQARAWLLAGAVFSVVAAWLVFQQHPSAHTRSSVDTLMQPHHDALMRTTIDLPDDLHRVVLSLAAHTRTSLSQTASGLIRRGLALSAPPAASASFALHPQTGLPVISSSRIITPEDVHSLEDD